MNVRFTVFFVLVIFAGCGKSHASSLSDGGQDFDVAQHDGDAGASDAALIDGGGASCDDYPSITEDAPCHDEGLMCGSDCSDLCQFCNVWACYDGRWQPLEAFPVPCFSCGDDECVEDTQYCNHGVGGARLEDGGVSESWECVDKPSECETLDCACLTEQGLDGTVCTDTDAGVRVDNFYP